MNWGWTASPIQGAAVSASAMLLAAIGLIVTLRRGHWLTTLLFSSAFLSLAATQAGTLGLVNTASPESARAWATYLARVTSLASWLWLTLSVVLGRPEPRQHLRNAAAYLVLALAGCGVWFAMAPTTAFIERVVGQGPFAVVMFGPLGKVYLMYLVVAMIATLMNLESMLRSASSSGQRRLQPLFLSILAAVLAELLVVSAGLLHGGLQVSWMVSAAPVLFVSGAAAAFALARRRLSDMNVPVARPVIYYSSVSLTLAGLFLLSMAVLSRLLPAFSEPSKEAITVAFLVFVAGGALVLMLSPATSRRIRRFVDRNFYANRYDYRREWERVSQELQPAARPEEIARQIETLVRGVFDAEQIALHVRDERTGPLRRLAGTDGVPAELPADHALVRYLAERQIPVVFHDLEDDLDLIPLVVESRPTLEAMHAVLCAPLLVGGDLVGLLWLSRKRADDDYTIEDVEFLAAMSRQLAAALWFARLAEQLAESRQLESLNRLSSFVLHDIKNQVSGLSLVVENARRHLGNPEFERDAMAVVERTVASLRELMNQVSGVARSPVISPEPARLRELVDESLEASGLRSATPGGPRVTVRVHDPGEVTLDRRLMGRVLVNLLVNAREALGVDGSIDVDAGVEGGAAGEHVVLSVSDNGRGMSEEFLRTRLFRPFSTTKPNGLGVGLAQCRAIVEAHGGRIEVRSRRGEGTTFTVRVPSNGPGRRAGGATAGVTDGGRS